MLRAREDLGDRALLDDLALRHDADAVGDLAHDAEVVGDEQHRHAEPRLHLGEQLQDLRLHGDVERRGRLVGDEQVGLVGERHGDHDALALAAGELVRIGAEAAPRVADADEVEQSRACARAPPRSDSPRCSVRISPTCCSIVCSGLSEVIGSWNTMVMSSPRTRRSSSSDAAQKVAAFEQDASRRDDAPPDRAGASGPRAP